MYICFLAFFYTVCKFVVFTMTGSVGSHHEDNHDKDDGKTSYCDIIPARYIISIMGFLSLVSSYLMRNNLSVAIVAMVVHKNETAEINECNTTTDSDPEESGDFEWDEEIQGLLSGSFYWGYIVTQVIGGRLAERYGAKLVMGVGMAIGAVATMISPAAAEVSAVFLGVCRIIAGMGLALLTPALHSLLSKWAPPAERSRMSTISYVGCMVGVIIGNLVNGKLCSKDGPGWEWAFYTWGIVTCGIIVMWMFLVYDSPAEHPRISAKELNYILRSQNKDLSAKQQIKRAPVPWKSLFKSPPVWALICICFGRNWTFYTLLTELPTYMRNVLGFNMSESGLYSSLPYILNTVLQLLASAAADTIIKRKILKVVAVRKISTSLAVFIPSILLIAISFITCNTNAIYGLLLAAVAVDGFIASGHQFNHADIAPNFAGTLQGITNSFGTIPGMISPYITGVIINDEQTQKNWNTVFFISAGLPTCMAIIYDIFASGVEQPWNAIDQEKISISAVPNEAVYVIENERKESERSAKSIDSNSNIAN